MSGRGNEPERRNGNPLNEHTASLPAPPRPAPRACYSIPNPLQSDFLVPSHGAPHPMIKPLSLPRLPLVFSGLILIQVWGFAFIVSRDPHLFLDFAPPRGPHAGVRRVVPAAAADGGARPAPVRSILLAPVWRCPRGVVPLSSLRHTAPRVHHRLKQG